MHIFFVAEETTLLTEMLKNSWIKMFEVIVNFYKMIRLFKKIERCARNLIVKVLKNTLNNLTTEWVCDMRSVVNNGFMDTIDTILIEEALIEKKWLFTPKALIDLQLPFKINSWSRQISFYWAFSLLMVLQQGHLLIDVFVRVKYMCSYSIRLKNIPSLFEMAKEIMF